MRRFYEQNASAGGQPDQLVTARGFSRLRAMSARHARIAFRAPYGLAAGGAGYAQP